MRSGVTEDAAPGDATFHVHLDNFEGPFDLLLQLIAKHRLDITEVALSRVTDEFIAHVKAAGQDWDLDRTSEFLVVAATLLDLKAARLLPSGEVEDPEDLALLEARDLLFARLLQYRAYAEIAAMFAAALERSALRWPRQVGIEARFARLLPEVRLPQPERFAAAAAQALLAQASRAARPPEEIALAHLHAATVSVREQAGLLASRLRRTGLLTFRALTGDAPDRVTTVARFLALLELFREGAVSFEQVTPLGELTVRWTGPAADVEVSDEFDTDPAESDPAETDPAPHAVPEAAKDTDT